MGSFGYPRPDAGIAAMGVPEGHEKQAMVVKEKEVLTGRQRDKHSTFIYIHITENISFSEKLK